MREFEVLIFSYICLWGACNYIWKLSYIDTVEYILYYIERNAPFDATTTYYPLPTLIWASFSHICFPLLYVYTEVLRQDIMGLRASHATGKKKKKKITLYILPK